MSGLGPLYPTVTTSGRSPPKPGQPESVEKLNFYSSQRQLPGNIQQLQPARAPQTRINTGLSGLLWQLVGRSRQLRQLVQLPGARCKKPTFHQNLPFLLENLPFLLEYFRSIFQSIFRKGTKSDKISTFRTCYWGRQVSRDVFPAARAPREAAKQPEPVHSPAPNCAAGLSADRRIAAV